jgi:hypothetical protein
MDDRKAGSKGLNEDGEVKESVRQGKPKSRSNLYGIGPSRVGPAEFLMGYILRWYHVRSEESPSQNTQGISGPQQVIARGAHLSKL